MELKVKTTYYVRRRTSPKQKFTLIESWNVCNG